MKVEHEATTCDHVQVLPPSVTLALASVTAGVGSGRDKHHAYPGGGGD